MTAADLAIYLMREDIRDKEIINSLTGEFCIAALGLLTLEAAAEIAGFGTATVKMWCELWWLDFVIIGDVTYIFYNEKFCTLKERMKLR